MLRSLKQLYGEKLIATDGEIGTIRDFYFDQENWTIRYLVADTGDWLASRNKVLISTLSLANRPASGKVIRVSHARKKIEKSPAIGSQYPVSRQHEEQYFKYYGWPPYWTSNATNMVGPQPELETHLHRTQSVTGYLVRVGDETLGHVCNFMVNIEDWKIGQLVVKTGHRLSGSEILIPTKRMERISYQESSVFAYPDIEVSKQTPAKFLAAGIVL